MARPTGWLAPAPDGLLGYLVGTWDLARALVDEAGHRGVFHGNAVVTGDERGATYHEEGRLSWPGYEGPAGRTLRYECAGSGALGVLFDEGRPFHTIELRDGVAELGHVCGADVYRGALVLLCPDEWRQTWQVRGPGKQLVITSRFRRRGPMSARARPR